MEMFTDYTKANAHAVQTGGDLYQTFALPDAYAVGEFTIDQEDDADFMASVEEWSVMETDYSGSDEEKEAQSVRSDEGVSKKDFNAQDLYDWREATEKISGLDLHDIFRAVCDGEPSPSGYAIVSRDKLKKEMPRSWWRHFFTWINRK